MVKHVLGQSATAQFLVAPLIARHVDVGDGAPERCAVLPSERVQILRSWSCQLIDLADVLQGIKQDRGHHLRNIFWATGDVRPEPKGSRMVPSRAICSAAQARKKKFS